MFLFSITLVVFGLGVFMMTVAEFVLVGQTSEKKHFKILGSGWFSGFSLPFTSVDPGSSRN